MSQPNRSRAKATESRRRPKYRFEALRPLEDRQLLAPYLSTVATDVVVTQPDTTQNVFNVDLNPGAALTNSAAPYVAVSQLTPLSSFGNNLVRIEAGPGGDFGKSVYAITRGINSGSPPITSGGRPGVIYRVDPATGDTSVFFDLNTVIDQIEPGATAANSAGAETGLVNWYDITFDVEGVFDGLPSMFVSSVDRTDPLKNSVYRIAPDGTFLGLFVVYTQGVDAGNLQRRPSAVLVPPAQQQDFLRGLFVGSGTNLGSPEPIPPAGNNTLFSALFFDANEVSGTTIVDGAPFPMGVSTTPLTYGPQVALASANSDYASDVYSAFTDFGQPAISGFSPALPGYSGLQGLNGNLLIGNGNGVNDSATPDAEGAISTPFRRFQDAAFDEFGFFSYGTTVTPGTGGALPVIGTPVFAGSLFVTDLATGLATTITPVDPLPTDPVNVPIQGPGTITLQTDPVSGQVVAVPINGNTTGGNVGGRVVRVLPDGTVTPFAEGFNTSGRQDSGAFVESSLSITFSADGTTLYVSDGDGIWQFKSTLSLAYSNSGELVGLGDLRTLGVPFQGEDTAVAVVDSGIDAQTPQLRGRVAPGTNVFTGGPGNDDLAAGNGHGTQVAGVIAQFVPEATLLPVNAFSPLASGTTNQAFYDAIRYVADTPFVNDPVRRGQINRVVAANFGLGTIETFDTEGTAFRQNKQLVIALKNQMQRLLHRGITPVAASGQFGDPQDPTIGNVNGEPLPAILSEVVSVTGSYSFPFRLGPTTPPTDPSPGPLGRLLPPASLAPDGATLPAIAANDLTIYSDRLLSAANRTHKTDFAAPALNVPTYRRTFIGDNNDHMTFTDAGTSLSSAMVTGSFAMLASALEFYNDLAVTGSTVNPYLTNPVDARALNFGSGSLRILDAYANPHGINSILQWTAVPAQDSDIPGDEVVDQIQPFSLGYPSFYREFSRVDVGNAIAAIEGSVALPYLFSTGAINLIDSNNNGLITAQEIENFVNSSSTTGMQEAGAMARLLGGTARVTGENAIDGPTNFVTDVVNGPISPLGLTSQLEQPGDPNVYQRRFNFFDYAADGKLDGVVSIQQFELLAHTLLPSPDSFVITDRQRGSAGGYLVDATPVRNWADFQRLLPTYAFVPQQIVRRFRNYTPTRFGINRGLGVNDPNAGPFYALFEQSAPAKPSRATRTAAERALATQANSQATQESPTAEAPGTGTSNNQSGSGSQNVGIPSYYDRYLNVAQRTLQEPGLVRPASSSSGSETSSTSAQDPTVVDAVLGQLGQNAGNTRVRDALSRLRPNQG
ncbi:S8 family serine peptidase [Tautonia sociabilis]|nr:S8 family serine peptidase [Tautonia sociabilis]